ncbi:MAG: GCN5-related N-acetyltransferase [Pseudomonadota bacterium]
MTRAALEARWLELTRTTLPALAATRAWPVSADHCFQRILLDAATGGCWYDAIAGRPAYRAASAVQLERAVELAEAVAAGRSELGALNARSLAWHRAA